ncbi:MAG: GNAT family N-acetyltransferase [Gammaproteobacteria bacterium]
MANEYGGSGRESKLTSLKPMDAAALAHYEQHSLPNYAKQKVVSGEWQEETALERAREAFAELLPQGLDTPGNHLFEIIDEWGETSVGVLWFAVRERAGAKAAYIIDIFVDRAHQNKGHASRALRALEVMVREMGLTGIGLNVFGQNEGAYRLYERLGYLPTNTLMFKDVETGDA